MPKVAPAWYAGALELAQELRRAGTRRLTEFPEASAESLLLLGFVTVEVSDLEAQEAILTSSNRRSFQSFSEVFAKFSMVFFEKCLEHLFVRQLCSSF